ncbi:hypothetical protein F4805DRAFT_299305 [Annulohypoxylon moriforme]|nr:hypothetical protein F4805DRAFT_299305 [Annulohypoxylon moriforme]
MADATDPRMFTVADVTPATSTQTFTLFSSLPPELRIEIWKWSLVRKRIIQTRIETRESMDELLAGKGITRSDTRQHEDHSISVGGYKTVSKLFRVNRESRRSALEFYRVHLQCWLTKSLNDDAATMEPGIVHINPEYDFIQFISGNSDMSKELQFIHDLKTIHDPRHVGLLNLAITFHQLLRVNKIDPSTLNPSLKRVIVETLCQLEEVYFVMPIAHTGFQRICMRVCPAYLKNLHSQQNHSIPVTVMAPSFNSLAHNAKPADSVLCHRLDQLHRVSMRMTSLWRDLMHMHLGGRPSKQTEYRVLLTGNLKPHGYSQIEGMEYASIHLLFPWLVYDIDRPHGIYGLWHKLIVVDIS